MIDLTDRVVLVTGAAGGIGSAAARALAEAGGSVALHDLDGDGPVSELAEELGDRALPLGADLSDPRAAADLWRRAVELEGPRRRARQQRRDLPGGRPRGRARGVARVVGSHAGRLPGVAGDALQARRSPPSAARTAAGHREPGQPRGLPRRGPRVLALRGRQGRRGGHDEDDRPPVRARRRDRLRHRPGLRQYSVQRPRRSTDTGSSSSPRTPAWARSPGPQDLANVIAFLASRPRPPRDRRRRSTSTAPAMSDSRYRRGMALARLVPAALAAAVLLIPVASAEAHHVAPRAPGEAPWPGPASPSRSACCARRRRSRSAPSTPPSTPACAPISATRAGAARSAARPRSPRASAPAWPPAGPLDRTGRWPDSGHFDIRTAGGTTTFATHAVMLPTGKVLWYSIPEPPRPPARSPPPRRRGAVGSLEGHRAGLVQARQPTDRPEPPASR